jgi:tetratricopeptide (TPR) repeat protein
LGDYNASVSVFLKAKKHSPYNKHILNNLGSAYFNIGKYQDAIDTYEELLFYYPNFRDAAANLTAAYIKNREVEKAVEVLKTRKLTARRRNELINYLKTMGVTL